MAEAEELVSDAARHATIYAQKLWRRYRPPPKGPPTAVLSDVAARLDLLISAVTGTSYPIRVAQPPAQPTLLARAFRRAQSPWQHRPIPATDGLRLWLPADSGLSDLEHGGEAYRVMALQQALRAQRGTAEALPSTSPALLADAYLLLEAWAADEQLAQSLPGMAGPPPSTGGASSPCTAARHLRSSRAHASRWKSCSGNCWAVAAAMYQKAFH